MSGRECVLTPYLCVADAREAMSWYAAALGAEVIGEPIVMDDGTVGHAELSVGGARVFLSDPFDSAGVAAPAPGALNPVSLHLDVPDCAAAVARVREHGGTVDREPDATPYGTIAVFHDPFGHRWMLNEPAPD